MNLFEIMRFWHLVSVIVVQCVSLKGLYTEIEVEQSAARLRRPRSSDSQIINEWQVQDVLSFSDDNDNKADRNGEYTSATLEKENLPMSFTLCAAFMVESWNTNFNSALVLSILAIDEHSVWGAILIHASNSYTDYELMLAGSKISKKIYKVFFPLQWTRICAMMDWPWLGQIVLVADGELLGSFEYQVGNDFARPLKLSLRLGELAETEFTGRVSDLNVFSSPLSVETMMNITEAGGQECGAPGDFLSWNEANWTLHSEAKTVEVESETEGPCRRESKMQVFPANFGHTQCMQHCQKIVGGRSPPVTSQEEWDDLTREVDVVAPIHSMLPSAMWVSATEGDMNGNLTELPHWPDFEVVNNMSMKVMAKERIWRDFYTGKRLGNWTKPYYSIYKKDMHDNETHNCIKVYTDEPWDRSWREEQCFSDDQSCPCQYPHQPLLRLRGLCEGSSINQLFIPKQLPFDPDETPMKVSLILIGFSTQIKYNETGRQWELTDAKSEVGAVSRASKTSYVLGKHSWTVSNDVLQCGDGKPYNTVLKLTGCNEFNEFTCDDGQCITMEERCNQVPDCRDKSDERGCQLIVFENGYNKNIPPIKRALDGDPVPAEISVSLTLMKVVDIDETDHSIHLQFEIGLRWRENRVQYWNLKKKTSVNVLMEADIRQLWLPLVIYQNTDQRESTRLGVEWEWATTVTVTREEVDFTNTNTKRGYSEVDEAEIFEGAENNLTMVQTYTHQFQCQYQLQGYPFDTQATQFCFLFSSYLRSVRSQ